MISSCNGQVMLNNKLCDHVSLLLLGDAFHLFLNETLYIFEPVNFFFEIAVAVVVLSFLSFDLFFSELLLCVCFDTILYDNRHAQFHQNIQ